MGHLISVLVFHSSCCVSLIERAKINFFQFGDEKTKMVSAFHSYKLKVVDLKKRSLFTCLNIDSFIELATKDEQKHVLDVDRYCAQQTNLWTILMRKCLF